MRSFPRRAKLQSQEPGFIGQGEIEPLITTCHLNCLARNGKRSVPLRVQILGGGTTGRQENGISNFPIWFNKV